MTKEKLQELLGGNFDEVVKQVSVKPEPKTKDPLKEYYPEQHPIFDKTKRPDVPVKNKDGHEVRKRELNRIALSFEQMISGRAAAFLCANPIVYKATPNGDAEEKMFAAFNKVNENNKLDFKNQDILEKRMSETEIAEIWYLQDLDEDDDYWNGTTITAKKKARLFIACESLGDKLWPVWDGQDNLIAFGREWTEKDEDEKEIKHFDLYTAEKIYEGAKSSGSKWEAEPVDNEVKKVVVIYHRQGDVEWANARTQIRRLELLSSNLGDSNDKTASPILFVEGEITSLPEGPTGRVMKGTQGTKVNYVTSDNAPESQKLEVELLQKYVYSLTDTPDISLDNLKGIGNTSGFAIQLMFMGAHLKASKHAGTFGECIQRRINLIKKMIVTMDPGMKPGLTLTITPTFDLFLPKDVAGIINYLTSATMGDRPLLSQETAVDTLQGALGGDGKAELDKIKTEMEDAAASSINLDNLINA